MARAAETSGGLVGAFSDEAFDLFEPEANVVAESDRGQISQPGLFPDPRFRDSKKLCELRCTQKSTAYVLAAAVREALAEHQGEERTLEGFERCDPRRKLGQESRHGLENHSPCQRGIRQKLLDS